MNLKLIDPTPEYLGHKIRVLVDEEMNNAPWFVATDTCKAIGITSNAVTGVLKKLDPSDRILYSIQDSGHRSVNVVSEPGFYELVLGSRKPGAVAFKRWVCSEVLPSIRKYGQYTAYADEDNNPINVPEVMVEMVRLTESLPTGDGTTETEQRLKVCEYVALRGLESLNQQQRASLGKIARRMLHTHGLPVLKRWRPLKHLARATGEVGVYPEPILDMAYGEFLKGMRD